MRNLVFFMHASLDGFVAGPQGEMNWIKLSPEMMDFVATMTAGADSALYGRVTYQLMESYWPTAPQQPNPTQHTLDHAKWYAQVHKVVLSRTLNHANLVNTLVLNENLSERILELKQQTGKNILIFGSPAASHSLLNLGLIDEFYIFVNPIILGKGMPLFKDVMEKIPLELTETKVFGNGVVLLHYKKEVS
ncbi:MAG: dihydrofolate reductase [Bacteroidia bacterium]|nr:dihydrofolate reductase [Bacteroidia bacterium]